ncbi:unnamed protein product [Clonostachys rhizophaga]|uniref:Zn(2)-C6 fungal-type domain-containing protein n=1 Tax=Clonostachys rhizophaga TaxID=160324 RepID=A0A9N9VE60_9HYPO|nr:unnamed protein product [Clonostachys rhizophaga]
MTSDTARQQSHRDRNPKGQGKDRKKPLTRSRTGCASCRQLHQKCDEQRPVCSNCVVTMRPCIYPPPSIPLNERKLITKSRTLPGQHAPWHVAGDRLNRVVTAIAPIYGPLGAPLDPFESLALQMPFKSADLLYYCKNLWRSFTRNLCGEYLSPSSSKHIVGTVGHDSNALRNTLLVASLHYSWSSGSMQLFTPTYLLHKVESLNEINSWMRDMHKRQTSNKIIRSITTHCIVEVPFSILAFLLRSILTRAALGNFALAQVHLKGLMSYIGSIALEVCRPARIEEELTNRYVLVIMIFVNGLSTRVTDVTPVDPHDSSAIYSMIRKGHREEHSGLENRLKALLMMPYFFSVPQPGVSLGLIDARDFVHRLSEFTKKSEARLFPAEDGKLNDFWIEGTATTLFLLLFETHMASIIAMRGQSSLDSYERSPLKSAWSPLVAGAALYMGCILALWDLHAARDANLQRYLVLLIREDVWKTMTWFCEWNEQHQQLWFWKVFVAAMSFAIRPTAGDEDDLVSLRQEMNRYIRYWSNVTGITTWTEARAALENVSWPNYLYADNEARGVWTDAIKQD